MERDGGEVNRENGRNVKGGKSKEEREERWKEEEESQREEWMMGRKDEGKEE